jgi:capsular exopolysaccharide synthesis family protein
VSQSGDGAHEEAASISLVSVWRAIRKGWFMVAAVAIGVTAGAAFYTVTAVKIYESRASLVLEPQASRPLGSKVESVDEPVRDYLENREYFRTQQEIFTSKHLAQSVVKRLRLTFDSGFIDKKPGRNFSKEPLTSESAAAEILRSRINVQFLQESRIFSIRLEDAEPMRAQQILSAMIDVFVQQNLATVVDSSTAAADWLDSQLAKLKSELHDGELSLHGYKIKNNILSVSLDDQSSMLREEMLRLNALLTDARGKREEISARRKEFEKIPEDNPLELPATEMLTNPVLSQERLAYVSALSERDALVRSGKGQSHPEVRASEARVENTRSALLAEIRNIKQAVERDYNAMDRQVGGLSGLLEKSRKNAFDLNLLEIEYNRLNRNKSNTEKMYSLVLERSKELDLTRMMRFNNIRVLDAPSVPEDSIRPRPTLNLALGMIAGLGLGVAAALMRQRLDRSLKTLEDIEQTLDVTAVGLLPSVLADSSPYNSYGSKRKTKQKGSEVVTNGPPELFLHHHPMSGFAEAARAVRTNILFMSPDHPLKVLLVTSPGPGEGKTTVACSLATAMAQAGQRVVLLDCDMRRPRIHRIFGRTIDVGISSSLLQPDPEATQPLSTEVENLSILPSGPIPPNPAELLHSAAFSRLLQSLRERYDRVIIDSSPVAPVTDATVLSTQVDGTVVVVRAFRTSRDLAAGAVRALRNVGANLVGVVLNDCDLTRHEYGYYEYYAYRKEGYGDPNEPGSATAGLS